VAKSFAARGKNLRESLLITGHHTYLTDAVKELITGDDVRKPCQKLGKVDEIQPQENVLVHPQNSCTSTPPHLFATQKLQNAQQHIQEQKLTAN